MARFLSWDPSSPGKLAWLRCGSTTTLVSAEQLRSTFGFENWRPSEEDIKAIASSIFEDLTGPPPQEEPHPQDVLDEPDMQELFLPPTPVQVAPPTTSEPQAPPAPQPPQVQQELQNTSTNIQVNIDSPTYAMNQQNQQNIRFAEPPRTVDRRRSRTPTSTSRARSPGLSSEPQALPVIFTTTSTPPTRCH